MTVGTRTPCQSVKRLQTRSCLDNGTQVRYPRSISLEEGPLMSEWKDILYNAVDKNTEDGDVLIFKWW